MNIYCWVNTGSGNKYTEIKINDKSYLIYLVYKIKNQNKLKIIEKL